MTVQNTRQTTDDNQVMIAMVQPNAIQPNDKCYAIYNKVGVHNDVRDVMTYGVMAYGAAIL